MALRWTMGSSFRSAFGAMHFCRKYMMMDSRRSIGEMNKREVRGKTQKVAALGWLGRLTSHGRDANIGEPLLTHTHDWFSFHLYQLLFIPNRVADQFVLFDVFFHLFYILSVIITATYPSLPLAPSSLTTPLVPLKDSPFQQEPLIRPVSASDTYPNHRSLPTKSPCPPPHHAPASSNLHCPHPRRPSHLRKTIRPRPHLRRSPRKQKHREPRARVWGTTAQFRHAWIDQGGWSGGSECWGSDGGRARASGRRSKEGQD